MRKRTKRLAINPITWNNVKPYPERQKSNAIIFQKNIHIIRIDIPAFLTL